MAYIPPLNGGRLNASIGGNSTSAGAGYALASTGTLLLAGGNNITLSQNGASVTISGANAPSGSINFSASNTSANLASVTFSNSNGVSFGLNAGVITASHNGITSQSNQTLSFSAGSQSTLTATGTFDARSLYINGVGNISAGFSNSSIFISGSQSAQTQSNIQGIIASGSTNRTGDVSFANSNGVTFGLSNNTVTASVAAGGGGGVALYDGAASISSGTARISGGGALTASVNGQTLSLNVPAVSQLTYTGAVSMSSNGSTVSIGAPAFSGGMSNLGNTSGSTGTVTNGLYLAGGNNVTLSQSTNGVSAATITISAAAQTNQTVGLYGLGNTTQNSSTTLDARSLSFNGLGAASVGYSNGSIQLSVPSQTNQTANFYVSSNSTQLSSTAGVDLRSVTFQGAGGASFGLSQGKVLVSVNSTYAASNHSHGNPTLNLTNISGTTASASNGLTLSLSANGPDGIVAMSAGTQSVSTGTMNFINSNGVSFGMSGSSQMTASHNGITSQTNQSLGLYGVGNTTGQSSSSTFDARTLSFQGAGAASVGYSNGSVVISAPNAAAGNVTFSAGGNSAGLASVVFSNSNGVSFGLNGSTITASAAGGAGGGIALANSQTTYTSGTANLNVAGGAMTIASTTGQSFNFSVPATSSLSATGGLNISTNGNVISIGVPGIASQWMHNSAAIYSSTTGNMINGTASVARMIIPGHISFSRVDVPVSISGATSAAANTAAMAISAVGVIYSRSGSTLNPIVGQSSTTTYSYASNSGVYSSLTGPRVMSFNLATSLSAGEYYFGFQLSSATSSVGTATTNLGWTVAPIYGTSYSALPWADMSAATNQTVNLFQPLQGINSVMVTNTTMTMQQSQVTQSGGTSGGLRGNFIVNLRNF